MKIVCKGNVEFLEINTFGDSKFLNPFYININKIRYIREYTDKNGHGTKHSWAIFVGNKMLTTSDDFGLNKCVPGDIVKIGKTSFECCHGGSLTDKLNCLYFMNYENVLYARKYIPDQKDGKNIKSDRVSDVELDKFAIITVDERVIPVDVKFKTNVTEHSERSTSTKISS